MVERNQSFVFGILFCELGPVVSEDFYLVAPPFGFLSCALFRENLELYGLLQRLVGALLHGAWHSGEIEI